MANVPHIGEILSLAAAALWALSLVLFRRSGERVHPIALNAFKDVLALVLFVPVIVLTGESLWRPAPARDVALLLASGVIGIAVADTLLFYALNMLGAGAYALVSALYSPIIIALSFAFLGERLTAWQLVGAALIVAAVLEVAFGDAGVHLPPRRRALAILFGVLDVTSMGVGVVIVKPVLDVSPLFWAAEVRLVGGVAGLALLLALHPRRRAILGTLAVRSHRGVTLAGSVVGGFVAMAFWIGGMQLADASVAAALNQTYTVLTLVLAAIILHEPVTPLRAVAVTTAFAGALLVVFG